MGKRLVKSAQMAAARFQGASDFLAMLLNRRGNSLHQAAGYPLARGQFHKLPVHSATKFLDYPVYVGRQRAELLCHFSRLAAGFNTKRCRDVMKWEQETQQFIVLLLKLDEPPLQFAERGEYVIVLFIAGQQHVLRLF